MITDRYPFVHHWSQQAHWHLSSHRSVSLGPSRRHRGVPRRKARCVATDWYPHAIPGISDHPLRRYRHNPTISRSRALPGRLRSSPTPTTPGLPNTQPLHYRHLTPTHRAPTHRHQRPSSPSETRPAIAQHVLPQIHNNSINLQPKPPRTSTTNSTNTTSGCHCPHPTRTSKRPTRNISCRLGHRTRKPQ